MKILWKGEYRPLDEVEKDPDYVKVNDGARKLDHETCKRIRKFYREEGPFLDKEGGET